VLQPCDRIISVIFEPRDNWCSAVVVIHIPITRGVQLKLRDPLRTRAIPERLTTRRYANPRLPYLTLP